MHRDIMDEIASKQGDTIRQLRARINQLEAALRPFAEFGLSMVSHGPRDDSVWAETPDHSRVFGTAMTFGDFRCAAAALGKNDVTYRQPLELLAMLAEDVLLRQSLGARRVRVWAHPRQWEVWVRPPG